jgi:hypothetical protein
VGSGGVAGSSAGDGVPGVAAGEGEVVAQVGRGLAEVHRLDLKSGGDALVEGGEHAHAQLPGQGGLAEQDPGERRRRIELTIGE